LISVPGVQGPDYRALREAAPVLNLIDRSGEWTRFFGGQKAGADGFGSAIPGQTLSLGRLTFGPAAGYLLRSAGMELEPHVGAKGIWDFDKAGIVDLETGMIAGSSDDLRARLEGGISVRLPRGASLAGEVNYDGIGVDDLEMYGGSVKLAVPLN
jgi:hypothetical protein